MSQFQTRTPAPGAAPETSTEETRPSKPTTPQAKAQAMTETMVKAGTVPSRFVDENGNVNQTHLFQTLLAMEQGEGLPTPDSTPSPATAAPTTPSPDAAPTTAEPDSLAAALDSPKPPEGVNLWELAETQLRTTGKVEDSVLAGLKAQGATDTALTAMATGIATSKKADMEAAYEITGGKEGFDATIAWAKENLSPQDLKTVQEGFAGPQATLVLQGLHARATAAGVTTKPSGQVDTSVAGEPVIAPNSGQLTPFPDREHALAAQRDKRYISDPAFRAEVETRIMLMSGASLTALREAGAVR